MIRIAQHLQLADVIWSGEIHEWESLAIGADCACVERVHGI